MNEIRDNKIQFMFGGNCVFTIRVPNGDHYSYKIYRKKTQDGAKIYQLYIKKGGKGTYCGFVKVCGNKMTFRHNSKYNISRNEPSVVTLLDTIHNRNNTQNEILHVGRCAHCGRPLTDPDSMERGFGPKCWAKVRIFIKERNNESV